MTRAMALAFLGLMAGSLYAIAVGPTTLGNPLPALSVSTFSIPGFAAGAAVLWGLERLQGALRGKRRARSRPGDAGAIKF